MHGHIQTWAGNLKMQMYIPHIPPIGYIYTSTVPKGFTRFISCQSFTYQEIQTCFIVSECWFRFKSNE